MTAESGKPWSLSATLRGFYDDNVSTLPDDFVLPAGAHRDSYGIEVSPSLQFVFPWEQTTLSFGYVYSMKYYDTKPAFETDHYDHTHNFSAALSHAFSERYSVRLRDSFVIGQEPDFLRAGNSYNSFQRISGDNVRNFGSIDFSAQMTPKFGVEVGYANTLYDYEEDDYTIAAGPTVIPSTSGLSDYMDHVAHLDGRYQLLPQTVGVLGFQYRDTDYTADQEIWWDPTRNSFAKSDFRNARSYYGYAGLDHNFRPDLTGSFRAGGRYTEYYHNPAGQDTASPYVMANLQYIYAPGSHIQVGASYDYSATSTYQFRPDLTTGDLTLNANSFSIFGAVTHRITPKLYGTVIGQYQNSTYYGGESDGEADNFYTVGVNLQYRFTPNFSAEFGYNFDKLDSDIQNTYDRNRVYIGVTGTY